MSLAFLRRLRCWGLLATIGVASIDVSAAETQPVEVTSREDANSLYERGAAAYRDGRFREAIGLFLAADELAPSPALSFNVARAYEKLGESARALEYYRDYLWRGPDAAVVETVERRIAELQSWLVRLGLQQVTVRSTPPGAQLTIDGARYGTTPWTGELSLGGHQLILSHRGHQTQTSQFQLGEAGASNLAFVLAAAPVSNPSAAPDTEPRSSETPPRTSPWAWMTLGAGALTLVSAGVVEVLRQDEEETARGQRVQLAYERAYERQETLQRTARVLAVVGGTLSVAGGVWLWLDASDEEERAGLACDGSGCMGRWRGSF